MCLYRLLSLLLYFVFPPFVFIFILTLVVFPHFYLFYCYVAFQLTLSIVSGSFYDFVLFETIFFFLPLVPLFISLPLFSVSLSIFLYLPLSLVSYYFSSSFSLSFNCSVFHSLDIFQVPVPHIESGDLNAAILKRLNYNSFSPTFKNFFSSFEKLK